ncbi:hypothetical protein ACJ41O_001190 [Fusarium nematophilum]
MQRLGTLIEAMKVYYSQYHGVEWVAKIARFVAEQLDDLCPKGPLANWVELLILHPDNYVKLTLALDWSLRDGRCPNKGDFDQFNEKGLINSESAARSLAAEKGVVKVPCNSPSATLPRSPGFTGILTSVLNRDMNENANVCERFEPGDQLEEFAIPNIASNGDKVDLDVDLHPTPQSDITTAVLDIGEDMEFPMENWDTDLLS